MNQVYEPLEALWRDIEHQFEDLTELQRADLIVALNRAYDRGELNAIKRERGI